MSSINQYDYAVFMGRFEPYHNGHHKIVLRGLEVADKLILVMGSDNRPRTIKNPFNSEERKAMILAALTPEQTERVYFVAQEDYYYSDTKWLESVQKKIQTVVWEKFNPDPIKITLIGHKKDNSSYYIDLFPQWAFTDVENHNMLSATNIRNVMFGDNSTWWGKALYNQVPEGTHAYLEKLRLAKGEEFDALNREFAFIEKYKKQWEAAPYPPTFVTCDATVIQSGHVLLVKRKAEPGKGLWAVPGGFLNPGERIQVGILRELKEETKIDVPEKVLRGSIKGIKVFDHPDRSLRGRTITHNALIVLPNGSLPKIKGSDDAEVAKWIPLGEVDSSKMFEDHYDMVQIQKDLVTG